MYSLESQLQDTARRLPIERNPFVVNLASGKYAREGLQAYASGIAQMARSFLPLMGTILAASPPGPLQLHLIENLAEEAGLVEESGSLVWRPDKGHVALACRFARAVGVREDQLSDPPAPDTWVDRAAREGKWRQAAAYFAVGLEGNVPRTFAILIPAFRKHYGIRDEEMEFFIQHLRADQQHGEKGARLLADLCRCDEDAQEMLEGARRGGVAWWWFHRSCHIKNLGFIAPQPRLRR